MSFQKLGLSREKQLQYAPLIHLIQPLYFRPMIGTPLHTRTEAICESYDWRNWAGYAVVSKYELTHEWEYFAIRNAAALIDVSPLYKYLVQGPDAVKVVDRIITRDASKCRVGQVLYTTWCDEDGKVIDDGTVTRLDDHTFRITAAEPNLRWFQDNAFGLDASVTDISEDLAALALQGPTSRTILRQVLGEDEADRLNELRYFRMMPATVNGCPVTISRTGFTGDLGYELWMASAHAVHTWDSLMAAGADHGIMPAGMLALDMTRIEAGLLLIDVDYTPARKARIEAQKSSPFELDLGWTVNLNKASNFNGRRALEKEKQNDSRWATVGLEVNWNALEAVYAKAGLAPAVPHTAWRSSVPIYANSGLGLGSQVGYATSGCFSPILKRYIALATVEPSYSQPGTELLMEVTVEHVPHKVLVRVVEKPFFDPPRKKA
ncbi:MAG TPA: aminomethyltransferase family protein [Anaerolineae bacterium]